MYNRTVTNIENTGGGGGGGGGGGAVHTCNSWFSKGLRNEFETAAVNEPSVFDPLKFYYCYGTNFMNKRQCRSRSDNNVDLDQTAPQEQV